jgi:glycosyltransferase involved in cell wall biosynthesis
MSTEDIVRDLAVRLAPSVPIVYHHLAKAGLSRAYNMGMALTDTEVVACTDDDVVVPRDWLAAIAQAFAADAEAGLLYGQVCIPSELEGVSTEELIVPSLTWCEPCRLHWRARNFRTWGMGADMALRRAAFDAVGGFDEVLGGGAPLRSSQDFDYAMRVYRARWAVVLDPAVRVDHYGARTPGQMAETMRNYGVGDGAYLSKHIRCGDPLAVRRLVGNVGRYSLREVRNIVRARRRGPVNPYLTGLFRGLSEGRKFHVDHEHRLYRESDKANIVETDANSVTSLVKQS